MVCRHCGLDTGSGAGHRSETECIQALSAEIERARRLLRPATTTRQELEPLATARAQEAEQLLHHR